MTPADVVLVWWRRWTRVVTRRRVVMGSRGIAGVAALIGVLVMTGAGARVYNSAGGTTTTLPGSTTTQPATTTTLPATTTTASTIPGTTTTTVPGADPCAYFNPSSQSLGRWPCPANSGVTPTLGVSLARYSTTITDLKHARINGDSCSGIGTPGVGGCNASNVVTDGCATNGTWSATATNHCPAGVTYDGTRGFHVRQCSASGGSQVVVDGWEFDGDFGLAIGATNNTHARGASEAATKAAACVVLTRSLVDPPTGSNGGCGICTGYTGGASSGGNFSCAPTTGCGPLYVADTEVAMPIGNGGFQYAATDTNIHMWRSFLHGTIQAIDSDGNSEVYDSTLIADRCETQCAAGTCQPTNSCAHGDAIFQDGGAGPWIFADHNTTWCTDQPVPGVHTAAFANNCTGDIGFFGDNAFMDGTVITNNLLKVSAGNVCTDTGVNQPAKANPAFRLGFNAVWSGNVFERGPGAGTTGHCAPSPVGDWDNAGAAARNDCWSATNTFDDGLRTWTNSSGTVIGQLPTPVGSC